MDFTHRYSKVTLAATLVIALHVVDDNLVQPAWGGISDHLTSTLVPLIGLAMIAYPLPRWRPGVRATLTLLLGLLGLMFGSEAIYDLSAGSQSGDDWTGLLAAVAGIALLVLGVRELWRSRRVDGSRWRKGARRSLRSIAALVVMFEVTYPVVESYAVSNASVAEVPASRLGVPYEDISFRTSDGLTLKGWFVPSTNGATVIVSPGRTRAQDHARMLIDHGYGVLLFDRRGTGDSDGEPNGYGWDGQRDIHAAVQFLQQRDDVDPARIGGIGLSVGGELMLQAAAESEGLSAVVSEGAGIRSVREARGLGLVDNLFAMPILFATTVSTAVFTNAMPPTALQDLVPSIDVPVFFIYASDGQGGEMLSKDYYDAANGTKELWAVDGSHVRGIEAEPEEYERRVVAFYDAALLAD
jgi:uncharacterized protein